MSKKVRRLFTSFQPQNYQLTIDPDRESMTLTGTVIITGKRTGAPSQRFTFHQNGLTITEATIMRHDKKATQEIAVSRINHQNSLEEVRLHTIEKVFSGNYTITMKFTAPITRQMNGVYPCFFTQDGQDKQIIATQFESHFARQAFPCVDEPEAKATFDLTLISPIGEVALGNTPAARQQEVEGKLVTTFQTTPIMSTYLLAFIYGDLAYKEATTKNGTVIRTYATRDNVKHTEFALQTAVRCLGYFEEYFALPFPLPKCDFVALPDFASGAMENWGLITFREHSMLMDPKNTSLPVKQYVAEVVCHELTHQWFGNLVTMRWWTDLWLNEGFANVMAYRAVDHLFPEWQMMTQYITGEQQLALKLDALQNTHPIEVAVKHPDEIHTIFDTISYSKGGSSILMLSQYLGEDAFRDGLRYYLKSHAYKNTDTVDLWEALETVSKKPVKQIMEAWTSQAGYPVVEVTIDGSNVHLSQEQFFVNPKVRAQNTEQQLWPIALNGGPEVPDVLDKATLDFSVTDSSNLKLNQNQTSFCRVIYDAKHTAQLAALVANGQLKPLDRLGVLGDAFEAAKAGYLDTLSALRLLEAYSHENHDTVWEVIAGNVSAIRATMNDEELRDSMKVFGRHLVAEQLTRLGMDAKEDDSHFDRLLRPTIVALAAISDEPTVIKTILERFDGMTTPEDLDPDMRGLVFTTAARLGDEKTFEKLLAIHNASTQAAERVTLASALTNFRQPELVARALSMIDSDNVRLQDAMYWLAYSFTNRYARQASWEWMTSHWGWLKDNLGADLAFSRLPLYAARVQSDSSFIKTYKEFFEPILEPTIERTYKQGLETIEWQSAWRDRDLQAIKAYFAAFHEQHPES